MNTYDPMAAAAVIAAGGGVSGGGAGYGNVAAVARGLMATAGTSHPIIYSALGRIVANPTPQVIQSAMAQLAGAAQGGLPAPKDSAMASNILSQLQAALSGSSAFGG